MTSTHQAMKARTAGERWQLRCLERCSEQRTDAGHTHASMGGFVSLGCSARFVSKDSRSQKPAGTTLLVPFRSQ